MSVHIAMFGWPLVVAVLFVTLPARRAVIAGILAGWLFLPNAGYPIDSLPDYTKLSATTIVVLMGAVLFDFRTLSTFRPTWYDLPITVWCVWHFVSSVATGYGAWDGISQFLNQFVGWGAPYLLGRVYFRDLAAVRELAVGLFISALVYLPLVVFEIRMSPTLHTWVYGFHQHSIIQAKKGDYWRPTVFLPHGLAVAMFMASGAIVGFGLWRSGAVRAIRSVPMGWLVFAVAAATALSSSMGATVLMVVGLGGLWVIGRFKSRGLVLVILAFPLLYVFTRVIMGWDGRALIDLAGEVSSDRAGSLRTRINSETASIGQLQGASFLYGLGRFIGAGMAVEEGGPVIIADAYWLIAFIRTGAVGLLSMMATLLLPCWMCLRRLPPRVWMDPRAAPAVSLSVVVALWMSDNMFNAMPNPIFQVAAGAVQTAVAALTARHAASNQAAHGPVARAGTGAVRS